MMSIGVLPCQGSSNTGAMTTKVTIEKVDGEKVRTVCALGLPLGIEGIIEKAKSNNAFIALNGCQIKCASRALQTIGVQDFHEVNVTELDIKKNPNQKDELGIESVRMKLEETIRSISR